MSDHAMQTLTEISGHRPTRSGRWHVSRKPTNVLRRESGATAMCEQTKLIAVGGSPAIRCLIPRGTA
jgi:hypothetical protein